MIIIQISCKTLRAKRELLKNEKYTWSSRDCICSNFYFINHLLNVSLKRKTNNMCFIVRRMTPEKRARAVDILRQGAGIRQESRFPKMFTNPVSCWQMSQFTINQTETSFSGRQTFRKPAFNDRWPIQTGNVINTYCCSMPMALALIRRRMMEMLCVFLYSAAFSKWVVT